jgi:hypothetical protein
MADVSLVLFLGVLLALGGWLWLGTRCLRGVHAPDPLFATLEDGSPAWECRRCLRRYHRPDFGTWKPELARARQHSPPTAAQIAVPLRQKRRSVRRRPPLRRSNVTLIRRAG